MEAETDPDLSEWRLVLDLSGVLGPVAPSLPADDGTTLDGFHVAADSTLTVAVTHLGPGDDPGWDGAVRVLEEHRLAAIVSRRADDRGRPVVVLRIRPGGSVPLVERLRGRLLLPARLRGTEAAVDLTATEDETEELEAALRAAGIRVVSRSCTGLRAPGSKALPTPEDWAFLGLLEAAGAHDAPGIAERAVVVARLGLDPAEFDPLLRRLEQGLRAVVSDIFAPTPVAIPASPGRVAWGY